jgi:hypothetical protein
MADAVFLNAFNAVCDVDALVACVLRVLLVASNHDHPHLVSDLGVDDDSYFDDGASSDEGDSTEGD